MSAKIVSERARLAVAHDGYKPACQLRAQAFASAGIEDGTEAPPVVHGGDPQREVRP